MRKKLFFLIPIIALLSFKPNVIKLDEVYVDAPNLLLKTDVIELPGQNIETIKSNALKWGDTYLANTSEKWTDEGEGNFKISCLVPFESEAVIGSGYMTLGWYINFLVEYKDGKVRYKVYDDGNEYEPETENTGPTEAHSYYFKDWFGKSEEIEEKGLIRKSRYRVVYGFNKKMIDLSNDFKAHMLGEKDMEDDW